MELQNDPQLKKEIAVILRRIEKKTRKTIEPSSSLEPVSDLAESSINFDVHLVGPFLRQLSVLLEGFGPSEISKVLTVVDQLEVDDEQELRFQVIHAKQLVPLNVRIFKDDEEAPDLYFFAPQALIEEIDKLMHAFCEEHDMGRSPRNRSEILNDESPK